MHEVTEIELSVEITSAVIRNKLSATFSFVDFCHAFESLGMRPWSSGGTESGSSKGVRTFRVKIPTLRMAATFVVVTASDWTILVSWVKIPGKIAESMGAQFRLLESKIELITSMARI